MTKQVVKTAKAPQPIGPYSQGVMVDGFLFVSGQGGVDPSSGRLESDIESQTRQTLTNVKNIVEAAGLSLSSIVRVAVYLKRMSDFNQMNDVYKTFFNEAPPTRTTVQVELPRPEMLIEIDAVAHQ